MLKHIVYAMPRLGISLPMQTPCGILVSVLLRVCTFSALWGCLIGVILFIAKPAFFLHLQALERDLPSACGLKTMAVLPACTQYWEHSSMWWITQWWRQFSSLSSPSSTALTQRCCTVQWTCEISLSEKLHQGFKPIYFPDLPQSSTTSWQGAGGMATGSSRSLFSQLCNRSIHNLETGLHFPKCWLWSVKEHRCLTRFRKVIKNEASRLQMDRLCCR